ncbi:MAG: 5-formyltetrahydrofolate cyclo-ligase [Clostridiales bacterium]|nr:5-formyltetrahydrofolate cyclo-ligase [Clostridiales bacterium]
MEKKFIRQMVKNRKALLEDPDRVEAARKVFERLEKLASFMLAEHVLLYNSLPDELSTREFMEKWAGRKHIYLPRVNGVDLDVLPYDRTRMHLGAFRIEEPDGDSPVDLSLIDMVVVPAVAYDRSGNRVGRGKGYYDRLLSRMKAVTVGVAYDFQLVDEIEVEAHDRAVDIVITPSGCIIDKHSHR